MTAHYDLIGWIVLALFILSYLAVIGEEVIALRKSKPMLLGAGLIWVAVAIAAPHYNVSHEQVSHAIHSGLEEFGSLLLFLLAAMTYVETLRERQIFAALQSRLVGMGLGYRQLFWATSLLAFCLSPVIDNLTTALVVGTILVTVGRDNPKFITLAAISAVNAANAGGAFSPFGDVTTLMVWQADKVEFLKFFALFLPAAACFLLPAAVMHFFVPGGRPAPIEDKVTIRRGGWVIMGLGVLTITMAVSFELLLGLPPFVGMMIGLSFLMMTGWVISTMGPNKDPEFDVIDIVSSAEWDTLLFFYGVMFCVAGLGFVGWLELASTGLYGGLGPTWANVSLGLLSAIIDNIPIMFAVLTMNPDLSHNQWLLITLTAGIGGSLLSVGSAAGVALMGVARGHYTFLKHLVWAPVLLLGYASGVLMHLWINGG